MNPIFTQEDIRMMDVFFDERCICDRTKYGYYNAFPLYVQYTGLHLNELLAEADDEEEKGVRWKKRKLKEKLIGYRGWLQKNYKYSTIRAHFTRIKTWYTHNEIEIGFIPKVNQKNVIKSQPITYDDIPTKEMLKKCVDNASPLMKAIILFMSSSGCARRETLNITIQDFIQATEDYHTGGTIHEILVDLISMDDVIPTFKIRRQKTNKHYYAFCSPQATKAIVEYLLRSGRNFDKGKNHHLLFKTNLDRLTDEFGRLNDICDGGKVADMNRIRSHMLRNFYASTLYNAGMNIDTIDALQGRAKDNTHKAYIKESPSQLKERYKENLEVLSI